MDFGDAVRAMKKGECLRRAGWNGKGMHIYIEDYFHVLLGKDTGLEHNRKYEPVICMFTAQKTHQPGWLANQPDILSEDWEIVPYEELNRK
jgi:hypothetical protein